MHLEAVVDAHAAAFIGRTPWEVAHDPALLADAHKTAWSCYRQRTITVGMDPYVLEADAWGAPISPGPDGGAPFASEGPILSHLRETARLPYLDPAASPRLMCVFEAARRLLAAVPATVAIPVAGPLALSRALAGRGAVAEAIAEDPSHAAELLLRLVKKLRPWLHAVGRCGAQAVLFEPDYDPAEIAPADYAAVVLPALRTLVQMLRTETSFCPALVIEGDTAPIANRLAESGAGSVNCAAGTDRQAFIKGVRGFPGLPVRVDLAPDTWVNRDWHGTCAAIAEATLCARRHELLVLGTGRIPYPASSVLVVDACNFAASIHPWMDGD
jgi:hypothetical protein